MKLIKIKFIFLLRAFTKIYTRRAHEIMWQIRSTRKTLKSQILCLLKIIKSIFIRTSHTTKILSYAVKDPRAQMLSAAGCVLRGNNKHAGMSRVLILISKSDGHKLEEKKK